MSLAVSRDVWRGSRSTGAARTVLLALADHARDDRRAWPSVSKLTRATGLHRSTVFRALAELERLGEITRDAGGGRDRNVYVISSRLGVIAPPVNEGSQDATAPVAGCDRTGRTVRLHTYKRSGNDQETKERRAARAPLPPDFSLTPELRHVGRVTHPGCTNLDACFADFVAYYARKGTRSEDWPERWRRWMVRHVRWGGACERRATPAERARDREQRRRELHSALRSPTSHATPAPAATPTTTPAAPVLEALRALGRVKTTPPPPVDPEVRRAELRAQAAALADAPAPRAAAGGGVA